MGVFFYPEGKFFSKKIDESCQTNVLDRTNFFKRVQQTRQIFYWTRVWQNLSVVSFSSQSKMVLHTLMSRKVLVMGNMLNKKELSHEINVNKNYNNDSYPHLTTQSFYSHRQNAPLP
jgi:hypothetical protein